MIGDLINMAKLAFPQMVGRPAADRFTISIPEGHPKVDRLLALFNRLATLIQTPSGLVMETPYIDGSIEMFVMELRDLLEPIAQERFDLSMLRLVEQTRQGTQTDVANVIEGLYSTGAFDTDRPDAAKHRDWAVNMADNIKRKIQ